jgi:hypothetical protein
MPSSALFPICRIDWRPDPYVKCAIPVLLVLSIYALVMSGLASALQAVLILGTALYAVVSFRRHIRQPAFRLESTACGRLWVSERGNRQLLASPVWRDWGYLIELSGRLDGNRHVWFWHAARVQSAQLRQLRLLMKAQHKKAAATLPSIITNPVL